jgi:hypothetical protein
MPRELARGKLQQVRAVDSTAVLELLRQHPCTFDDLTTSFTADAPAIVKCLDQLIGRKKIRTTVMAHRLYYHAAEKKLTGGEHAGILQEPTAAGRGELQRTRFGEHHRGAV